METKANERFSGVISLLLTPFQEDGTIDWNAYDAYVDWQLSHRPTGLFGVCGSSEMMWLTPEERVDLARRAVQRAGDTPVMATSNLDPDPDAHGEELARMAETGIAAAVLVPPPFSDQPERYQEYLFALTEDAPCPVVLYEWPQVPNYFLDPAIFDALTAAGRIAGIKDTTCTMEGIRAKHEVARDAIIYQANTAFMLESLEMGVRGIMAITSAACADRVVQLWEQHQSGDPAARQTHRELVALDALLGKGYPATAKYLAAQQGVPMSTKVRWQPSSPLPAAVKKALSVWLEG